MMTCTHLSAQIRLMLVVFAALSTACASPAPLRIRQLAEMNTTEIQSLDRQRTVILIPGGIMEEHGPYLPSFSDGYQNERYTSDLASAIAARPDWNVVIFPIIPLGSGGANAIGGKLPFPGTFAVRPQTLRAVFMDLADEFGEQGFRWILIVHVHGGPEHNQALDAASDYFRDTYGGKMVNVAGLDTGSDPGVEAMKTHASQTALDEEGFSMHAGLLETSRLMAMRPDLVAPSLAQAPSFPAHNPPEAAQMAAGNGWPGYFGAPRHSTADLGRKIIDGDNSWITSIALQILDGQLDERKVTRIGAAADAPDLAFLLSASRQRDLAMAKRQQDWLATQSAK